LAFNYLLLEVECKEHMHLISEGMTIINLNITIDVEYFSPLQNVSIEFNQVVYSDWGMQIKVVFSFKVAREGACQYFLHLDDHIISFLHFTIIKPFSDQGLCLFA